MRIVLDTNVLAPGFLSQSSGAAKLLDLWRDQAYDLVVSEHILTELARTWEDPYFRKRITPSQIEQILGLLRRRAIVTEITVEVSGTATQPADDLVIATALSGGASFLATRDRQLLKIEEFQGLHIVFPGTLLAKFEDPEPDLL